MRRSSFANNSLYVGMGIVASGMILILLSIGKQGIKAPVVKDLGPWLTLVGFIICLIRVVFCFFPRKWTKPFFGKKTRDFLGMDNGPDLYIVKDENPLVKESIEAANELVMEVKDK